MGEPYNHSAILQRLNVFHQNGGKNVYYSLSAFEQAEDWNNIPVFMAVDPTNGHPEDFGLIENGHVPDGYKLVGHITGANIPSEGTARLEAELYLYDYKAQELAKSGNLALSTGFKSDIRQLDEDGNFEIVGTVTPNHVLVFEQGITPNSYPNDQGAMLTNQVEVIHMADEEFTEKQKGFLTNLIEKLHAKNEVPLAEVEAVEENGEIEELKTRIAELEKALEERDALIAEKDRQLLEMQNACAQQKKDEEWEQMKNMCPSGWLENEAETRAQFEADPSAFALKLVNHKQQFANMQVSAEGTATASTAPVVDPIEQYVKESEAKFGVKF